MGASRRQETADLTDASPERALQDEPCSFEFYQAVTLLQRLHPDRQPVGRFSNPQDEAVRFGVNTSLAFPASEIQSLKWDSDEPPEMEVNFYGLTGPLGVLPYCYSELMRERERVKDNSLRAFLNIFNHRMISFLYRAWEKYRFPVTYGMGVEDLFTHHLLDLVGLGTAGLRDRQAIPDEALLHYAGLLGLQTRSASALEGILSDYFGVPVEIEQFAGAWYRLAPDTQCRMEDGESESEQLGVGAVVGDEIWDQQSRVRIRIGPMELGRYRDFLPDGTAYEPLRALTRFFSNDEFDFEVQLILKSEEVPRCELGLGEEAAPRLGWVAWLKSAPLSRDPDETILNL